MEETFDVIEYLSGLTNFVFDKNVLKRVAYRREILFATSIGDIDETTEKLCTKDLLVTAIRGPWSTATMKSKHGTFEVSVGSQTITSNALEEIKAQIRLLNRDLGMPIEDGIPQAATNVWIAENDW